jgi:STE24 endopeptidase
MDRLYACFLGLPLLVLSWRRCLGVGAMGPDHWWSSLLRLAALVLLAHLAPVWLLPLFSRCEPLQRPTLSRRLVALAERAGTPVLGVFEWQVSDRTRKANAALAGIGRTRRILLSDTLLAEHSDDEVEVIVAHELAHHVHHDIWRAMAFESGLTLLGFYLADRVLGVAVGHFGVTAKFDVAAFRCWCSRAVRRRWRSSAGERGVTNPRAPGGPLRMDLTATPRSPAR